MSGLLRLIKQGSHVPHRDAVKTELREGCTRLYREVESLREFIIENAVVLIERTKDTRAQCEMLDVHAGAGHDGFVPVEERCVEPAKGTTHQGVPACHDHKTAMVLEDITGLRKELAGLADRLRNVPATWVDDGDVDLVDFTARFLSTIADLWKE